MSRIFETPLYSYRRSSDQDAARPARHPVVIVGAGPVGLTLAIGLRQMARSCSGPSCGRPFE